MPPLQNGAERVNGLVNTSTRLSKIPEERMWPSLYTYLLFYLAGLSLSGTWVILLHHVGSFVAVCRLLSSCGELASPVGGAWV